MTTIISNNKVQNIVEYVMDNKTIENRQNNKAVGLQNPYQDQEIVIDEMLQSIIVNDPEGSTPINRFQEILQHIKSEQENAYAFI